MGLNIRQAGGTGRGVMVGITGQSGAGKTSLAATFPKPLILDLEGGSAVLAEQGTPVIDEWERTPRGRLDEVLAVLREVSKTEFRTVVIDSSTRLSEWIEADILDEDGRAQSLMAAFGGYAKGRDAHVTRTAKVIEALQWLQGHRGMHVVWNLHEKVTAIDLPTGEHYSYFGLEGVAASAKRILMACDVVAQLRQEVTVIDSKDGAGKAKGTGKRELFVGSSPYMDTKSRFHREPVVLPVEWGVNPLAAVVQ